MVGSEIVSEQVHGVSMFGNAHFSSIVSKHGGVLLEASMRVIDNSWPVVRVGAIGRYIEGCRVTAGAISQYVDQCDMALSHTHTRSPFLNLVTPSPSSSTTPAIS